MDVARFSAELEGFIGSTQWFEDRMLPGLRFTEGVKFFVDQTQAVAILVLAHREALAAQQEHPFLSLVFEQNQTHCTFSLQDGNYGMVKSAVLHVAEIPTGRWEFWMEQGVLYLPSEH